MPEDTKDVIDALHWDSHQLIHDVLEKNVDRTQTALNDQLQRSLDAHEQVHRIHEIAHEREHNMTNTALTKAEESMNQRLEGMNQFREQLNAQTQNFVTREVFEKYTKDLDVKMDLALSAMSEKFEALVTSLVNRHNADYNTIRELLQSEKEIRRSFEGSINTWKWIAGFLGASGVAGVILLFATRAAETV